MLALAEGVPVSKQLSVIDFNGTHSLTNVGHSKLGVLWIVCKLLQRILWRCLVFEKRSENRVLHACDECRQQGKRNSRDAEGRPS